MNHFYSWLACQRRLQCHAILTGRLPGEGGGEGGWGGGVGGRQELYKTTEKDCGWGTATFSENTGRCGRERLNTPFMVMS